MIALGIDTSNYATSLAVFDGERVLGSVKRFLPVPEGALGLRQSDAVFAHTKVLPEAFKALGEQTDLRRIDCIGVSDRPRTVEGSYMPCFLVGVGAAAAAGTAGKPVFSFSHQQGHVMAALFGCGLHREPSLDFLAFHISGGTTDALICGLAGPSLSVNTTASSRDLFAGQVVDRVGAMLGLSFPAGEALSELAARSHCDAHARAVIKEDGACCLSGLENQCRALVDAGRSPQDVARFCLLSVAETVAAMVRFQYNKVGEKPLVFAGGVMSSAVIRPVLKDAFPTASFCEPSSLSADNGVGVAALALRQKERL